MFGFSLRRIVFILVLICVAIAGSQYGPAYYNRYLLDDSMRQTVKFAASARKTPEIIKREIVTRANELDIPIKMSDVKFTSRGPTFTVEVSYSVPINLQVVQRTLDFHLRQTGEFPPDAQH